MYKISPSREEFIKNAESGRLLPVFAELHFIHPRMAFGLIESPDSFLFESIKGPEKIARYSFMGSGPFMTFKVKNGSIEINHNGEKISSSEHPLKKLRELLNMYKQTAVGELPPFTGGAAGMISYDFVNYLERLPRTVSDDLNIPDADFMLFDMVIAIDHISGKTFIISSPGARERMTGAEGRTDWGVCYDRASEKINSLYVKLREVSPEAVENRDIAKSSEHPVQVRHEMGKQYYMDIVKKVKEYIKAGDIFQANLSQRVSADIGSTSAWDVYKILSNINPSPFAAYMNMGEYCIASSSPERLVKVNGRRVETRPIAGTRPRGADAEGDRQMTADLLLNEKERAEHLMLIDLERNDLGRISDYSTVKVDELMITEEYSHVIHIVSNVTGEIVKGRDCFDVIRATFPGGTITGVPKVRCMEIIDELEPVARGPYTGSAGYIGFNGNMDLNIIIRTFVIKDGIAYVQAGAGIVADSDPEKEYYETLKKAEALLRTLEVI